MKTAEPIEIFQGESLEWTKTFPNYSLADGWTLFYYFRGPGIGLDFEADPQGSSYLVQIPSVSTQGFAVGTYSYQAWLIRGAEKVLACEGTIKVRAGFINIGASQAVDARSQIKKDLDAVREAIRTLIAGGAVQEYGIGNRNLKRMPLKDLRDLEADLQAKYSREIAKNRMKKGGGLFKTVNMRLNDD